MKAQNKEFPASSSFKNTTMAVPCSQITSWASKGIKLPAMLRAMGSGRLALGPAHPFHLRPCPLPAQSPPAATSPLCPPAAPGHPSASSPRVPGGQHASPPPSPGALGGVAPAPGDPTVLGGPSHPKSQLP
ncbi:cone-rod homeobox protein [Platysternon megacephalum]|uniref:Cone-rod homeobox protein n=1 Tax=Platysternon megacephalum TaxID=55544 RepID=A0A4D9E1J1_9SAUR|nr:cone-rod homeobox protein [Platysternon megacephalum]